MPRGRTCARRSASSIPTSCPALTYQRVTTPSTSTIGGGINGRVEQSLFGGTLQLAGRDAMGGRPLHGRLHLVANRDQQRALAAEPAVSLVARRELRAAPLARPDDRRGAPADPARAQGGGSHRRAADPDRDGSADARRAGVLGPGVCRSQPGGADAGARAGAGPGVEQRAAGARRHPRPDRRRRSADPGRQLPADRRLGAAGVDRGGEPVEDADAGGTRSRHLEPGAAARGSGRITWCRRWRCPRRCSSRCRAARN